ncbi:hypothetical protein [Hydrotalea sp.]|uniref:hypothetical protein n=1 Tax=Hydrotalea sp. TaxID=2881279 RepID=UPI002584854F|nr:hypothetical protein [Hydrotalea sp.]
MKTDLYTKSLLTVIASCLTILTLKEIEIIPKANAAATNNINTPKSNYGLVPINQDGSINVKLNSDQVIDVKLVGVDESPYLRWEAIKVKVEQ